MEEVGKLNTLQKWNKSKSIIQIFFYVGIFCGSAYFMFYYLNSAVGRLPVMDYWKEGGRNLDKIMTNKWGVSDIFPIPHALHWNPLYNLADPIFVKLFKCDNLAYVYAGALCWCLTVALVIYLYQRYWKTNYVVVNVIGCIACVFPLVNLNQWEIFTLYCNFIFMVRVFVYLLSFYLLDRYFHKVKADISNKDIVFIGVSGIICILCISQAYFPGYVIAVIVMLGVDYIQHRKNIKKYIAICALYGSGVLLYLVTLSRSTSMGGDMHRGIIQLVGHYLKGMLIMLGATFVSATQQGEHFQECYIIGGVVLVLTVVACILYFKKKLYCITYIPMMCIIYEYISIFVIVLGRADSFGMQSLGASRYVVETTVGLLGLAQIYWMVLIQAHTMIINRIVSVIILGTMIYGIYTANLEELAIAPYRKEYNQAMVNMALDIDNVSDEDLAIFQAPAEQVRDCVKVMKKYHLSLWQD